MAILRIGLLHIYILLHLQEFNIGQLIAYFLTYNFITAVGIELIKVLLTVEPFCLVSYYQISLIYDKFLL